MALDDQEAVAFHEHPVIAYAVKQSMTAECMAAALQPVLSLPKGSQ
jgi:hypothetical protein